ncbi:hypothetical protein ScPMuIL_004958 [Solemya velum]
MGNVCCRNYAFEMTPTLCRLVVSSRCAVVASIIALADTLRPIKLKSSSVKNKQDILVPPAPLPRKLDIRLDTRHQDIRGTRSASRCCEDPSQHHAVVRTPGTSVLNPVRGYPDVGSVTSDIYLPTEGSADMYTSVIRFRHFADQDPFAFAYGVRCLQKWPVNLLSENPHSCLVQYYNRGQVLVRDSSKMDWIYIVKSGSLTVLKKLREVKPLQEKRKKPKQEEPENEVSASEDEDDEVDNMEENQDELDEEEDEEQGQERKTKKYFGTWFYRLQKRRQHNKRKRPKLREKELPTYKSQYDMERRLEQTLPGIYNTRDRLGMIDYDSILHEHRARVVPKTTRSRLKSHDDTQPNKAGEDEPDDDADEDQGDEGGTENEVVKLPEISMTSKGAYLSTNRTKKLSSRRLSRHRTADFQKEKHPREKKGGGPWRREVLGPRRAVTNLAEANSGPLGHTFIGVAILERGNYFGINHMIYSDQPNFSLVSNGAEVIQISRKFFLDKATDDTLHHLRCNEVPFPKDDEMQENLQKHINWCDFRSNFYNSLVQRKVSRDNRRHQYVTQYIGQYCFRTGPV